MIFTQRKLFFFVGCFDAAGADFGFYASNFLALQVDLEFSQGFDIGMADRVTSAGSATANFTNSRHIGDSASNLLIVESIFRRFAFLPAGRRALVVSHRFVDLLQDIR